MAEVLFICPQVWFSCHDIVRSWRSSYRNRIQSTAPTGHVKDILKEWRSPALYLPMLTVHAGPTAIHPRSSQYCFLVDGCINEFRESDSRQPQSLHQPGTQHGLRLNSQHACLQQTLFPRERPLTGEKKYAPPTAKYHCFCFDQHTFTKWKRESFFEESSKHSSPPLSPSRRVSYSVWTGGNLGTSVGQLSEEGGGVCVGWGARGSQGWNQPPTPVSKTSNNLTPPHNM